MTQVAAKGFMHGDTTATVTAVVTEPAPTRTITDLVDEAAWIGSQVGLLVHDATQLHAETNQLHVETLDELLKDHASKLAKNSIVDLLGKLGKAGFSWRDIALLIGVSVPAVRKWRHGEPATGENRYRIARLVALSELLEDKAMIADPASWLEVPVIADVPICGLDLLAARREDLVLQLALQHDVNPELILDEFEPSWQSTYRGTFEVFESDDGELGLHPRESDE